MHEIEHGAEQRAFVIGVAGGTAKRQDDCEPAHLGDGRS
jgi:hypothetical protein